MVVSMEAAEEARRAEREVGGEMDRVELKLKKHRLKKQNRVGSGRRKAYMCLATIEFAAIKYEVFV